MKTSLSSTRVPQTSWSLIIFTIALIPGLTAKMASAQSALVASEFHSAPPETHRVLGVVRVSSSVPLELSTPALTVSEKWKLFSESTFDPGVVAVGLVGAAVDGQAQSQPGYGGGASAFGQKVGAITAQYASTNLFAKALLPSVFHQDPRFFRKDDGPSRARFLYGLTRPLLTRADGAHTTLNTSLLLGTAMSVALSNAYYPEQNRNAKDAAVRFGLSLSVSCVADVVQEFWKRHH